MANRPSQNHRTHLRQEERRLEYLDDPGGGRKLGLNSSEINSI